MDLFNITDGSSKKTNQDDSDTGQLKMQKKTVLTCIHICDNLDTRHAMYSIICNNYTLLNPSTRLDEMQLRTVLLRQQKKEVLMS